MERQTSDANPSESILFDRYFSLIKEEERASWNYSISPSMDSRCSSVFEISHDRVSSPSTVSVISKERQSKNLKPELTVQELLDSNSPPTELIFNDQRRKIYFSIQLTEQEERLLYNFKKYLTKKHLEKLLPSEVYEDNLLALRCLQSCAGDFNKAFDKIRSILLWRSRKINDKDILVSILVRNI